MMKEENQCKCIEVDSKTIGLDYKKEYEVLQLQNHFLREELEKYKQALLNICLKFKE